MPREAESSLSQDEPPPPGLVGDARLPESSLLQACGGEEEGRADKPAGLERNVFRNPEELSHFVRRAASQQDLYSHHTTLRHSILAFLI